MDLTRGMDLEGALLLFLPVVGTLLIIALGIAGRAWKWDDWLDERSGRGSVRDWWLLRNDNHRERTP